MNDLLQDISQYLQYLKSHERLEIAICDVNPVLLPAILQLQPFYGHNLSYCILLKKNAKIYKLCKKTQEKVRNKLNTVPCFCGTCFAGMGEHVYRIAHGDVYLGFLSVSGFCLDASRAAEKLDRLCRRYRLNKADLQKGFDASTAFGDEKCSPPRELSQLITPLLRMLELLYLEAARHTDTHNLGSRMQVFLQIKSYIHDNFTNDVTIEDICEHLHYSRSYVSHIFVHLQKETIVDYINGLRIEKAKELLYGTNYSVSEIAMQVGFKEPNYFTNTFKKYAAATPTKYRREARK